MPQISCSRCCTVGEGTLIIGMLNIIEAILSIIYDSVRVYVMINCPDKIEDSNLQQHLGRYGYITLGGIQILMAIVFLILACIMVHGYRKRNHRYIMPWLVWSYVSLGLAAVGMVILFAIFAIAGDATQGFIVVGIVGLFMAVQTYFVLVVKRFVAQLKGRSIY